MSSDGSRLFERATVDPGALDPEVRAELGQIYEATEELNRELRTEVEELRVERDSLRTRVDDLDAENDELAVRLGELATEVRRISETADPEVGIETEQLLAALPFDLREVAEDDRPAVIRETVGGAAVGVSVPADTVLSEFTRAVDRVESDEGSRFTVSDLSVTLRTGVDHDDGLRFRLPGLAAVDAEELTDVRFSVRPRPTVPAGGDGVDGTVSPLDYDEVPQVVGRSQEAAESALTSAGFTVGEITTAPGEPGIVLEQLPSSYALAEPDAPVDLVVGTGDPEDLDTGESRSTLSGIRPEDTGLFAGPSEMDETDDEDTETEPSADESDAADDRSESPSSGADADGRSDADVAAGDAEERDPEPVAEADRDDLRAIDGIGPTYAGRLRDAGLDTYDRLVAADAERVAAAANTSASRVEEWMRAANRLSGENR